MYCFEIEYLNISMINNKTIVSDTVLISLILKTYCFLSIMKQRTEIKITPSILTHQPVNMKLILSFQIRKTSGSKLYLNNVFFMKNSIY